MNVTCLIPCFHELKDKSFIYFFQLYIALTSLHALFLGINHFIICIQHDWKECSAFTPPATVVFLIFLIFEALLFTIFTAVMLGSQLQAIWNDETVRPTQNSQKMLYIRINSENFKVYESSNLTTAGY